MVYETLGVTVEGLALPGYADGLLFLLGSSALAHAASAGLWAIPRAIVAPPSLSAIGLDPLTGDVRSGALTVQLNATGELCGYFARQARARKVDAVLNADASASATTLDLSGVSGAINPDDLLYLGDELVHIVGLSAGTIWTVERAYGGTIQQGHRAGANLYRAPPYWIGRAVTIWRAELNATSQTVTAFEAVWRGYLTEPPSVGTSVTTIVLKAEDALSALRRASINRAPLAHVVSAPMPYRTTDGQNALAGLVQAETGEVYQTSVHRRFADWISDGAPKVLQIGTSLFLSILDVLVNPGLPLLNSPALVADEPVPTLAREVALWSRAVDEYCSSTFGVDGPSPTIRCEYPYHPLTIAAALLFSDASDSDEDALVFNVMHPSCTLGVGFLADFGQWDALIRKTSHIEVDQLVLFWDSAQLDVFTFITRELLPAYGFLIAADAQGRLRPVQIGLADIEQYATAPQVTPISGTWEWTLSAHGALDAIDATIGALPWAPGRTVEVSAQGVRDPSSGSRATRLAKRAEVDANYPTIAASAAESYGAARLANTLAWRYDGLPVVSCLLQADEPWYVGQYVRVLKPAGLLSPILFDADGQRVDTLWDTAALIGQIIKLRRDLTRNRYEVDLLLTNYSYGKAARWRAPAARIKSRTGTGTYLIEGTTSDFGEAVSDALSMAAGDDVVLLNAALGVKAGTSRSVTSITASGSDWLITLNADFSVPGTTGDWITLGTSAQYLNAGVVAGENYPYVFMTDAAALNRPASATTDPDEYS